MFMKDVTWTPAAVLRGWQALPADLQRHGAVWCGRGTAALAPARNKP